MLSTTAVVYAQRPISSTEKAKAWATNHRVKLTTKGEMATVSIDRLLLSSYSDDWMCGDLTELRALLVGLEDRLQRTPCMGDLCDATAATQGKLYELREELLQMMR